MNQTVIIRGARTPVGVFMGGLSELTSPQLGSAAIKAALEKSNVKPSDVNEVLMGCVLTGGVGQAPARQASLGAGIPNTVPCTTINKVCGSGLKAVMLAASQIAAGEGRRIVAGGGGRRPETPALSRALPSRPAIWRRTLPAA